MKLKYAFQRGVASALIAGVVLTVGLPALAAGGAETAKTESAAVVQVVSPSDEGAAQDESGVRRPRLRAMPERGSGARCSSC